MERLLLKRFKRGDRAAFKALYESSVDSALRLAKVIMKHDKLAEDAVQEAFLRAYIYRKGFDEHKPFEQWLHRILINECKRCLKENRVKWQHIEPEKVNRVGKNDDYDFEQYEVLYKALKSLPEGYRIPITLKYINGYSEDAIADVLALKKSTVKSRLYDGRQKMRQALMRLGYGDEKNE